MPGYIRKSKDLDVLSTIAKNYNTLQYSPQLIDWLTFVNPKKNYSTLSKFQLHKELNNALLKDYAGEFVFKYALFKEFVHKRLVGAFEMKVNSSRADFVTINGSTTSFEIKSTKDNLAKLTKQSSDYLSTFEYNYLVLGERHLQKALKLLPDSYGIWIYREDIKKIYRKASPSTEIKPASQLSHLSKKEIFMYFGCSRIGEVLEKYEASMINRIFKTVLKARYQQRWDFVVQNSNSILPIDLQFFFNLNVSPGLIYK